MREYTGPTDTVYEVAFVPGGPPRLAAATDTEAYVWDLDRPEPAAVLSWDETAWGEPRLAVSPDGRWLVAGPAEHLRCWDVSALPPRGPRRLDRPGLLAAGFTGRADQLTVVYRADDRRECRLLREEFPVTGKAKPRRPTAFELGPELAESVRGINPADCRQATALSAGGSHLALCAAARSKAVHLWAADGGPLGPIAVRRAPNALGFSPDGSRLAIDAGTTVYVYDTARRELAVKWKAVYSYVPRLAWSPDGRLLARTDRSRTVRAHDAVTGRRELALGAKRGALVSVAFSPDGLTVATGTWDGLVRVWDVG
jgi:WD40 repeat protein